MKQRVQTDDILQLQTQLAQAEDPLVRIDLLNALDLRKQIMQVVESFIAKDLSY